jgi:hypothetical protein
MPKEAIDLEQLMERINTEQLKIDRPLLEYRDVNNHRFWAFQNSGLNILLGFEGNGKTKYLTHVMIEVLQRIKAGDEKFKEFFLLYVDMERPESQYAYSIRHIIDRSGMTLSDITQKLHLLAVSDLDEIQIKDAIECHVAKHPGQKFIIIIDHILPLVIEMNDSGEASRIDLWLKRFIVQGHIIIASIHKPYGGTQKGLGHIGSSVQRLASSILEIHNSEDGRGFGLKQVKSRISPVSNSELILSMDDDGNIDTGIQPVITVDPKNPPKKEKTELADEIFLEFKVCPLQVKKQLFEIIARVCKYNDGSSSINTFYNQFLKDRIRFEKDSCQIVD